MSLMTDDRKFDRGKKNKQKNPSDLERTLASLPVVFNGSYGMSSLPSHHSPLDRPMDGWAIRPVLIKDS